MFGSPLVKHAFVHARNSYDGVHLGMQWRNANIWWQGRGGLRWSQVMSFLSLLLTLEAPPDILVIHCGGNDIGHVSTSYLRKNIVATIKRIIRMLPNTRVVWSQILPRLRWRNEQDHCALEKARLRVNSFVAKEVISLGGGYIRYPEISEANTGFFLPDQVHLSAPGNDLFLYRIQQALQSFLSSDSTMSPPVGEDGPWQMFK